MLKVSITVRVSKSNMKSLHALYAVSNKYQMGKNGVIAKDWHSVNDGQQVTVSFQFSSKESADALLADPIFAPLTEYLL